MKELEFSRDFESGTWKYYGGTGLLITCPQCGGQTRVDFEDYEVSDDGVVTPAFLCTNQRCEHEVDVILNGYTPG